MKPQTSDTPDKPALNEGTFQQLLAAAFVLQQHKERLQVGQESESGLSKILTQVLEIQEQIRNRRLDLQAAATTVARRIREFTDAAGAAVGILDDGDLEYYAASGSASGELGSRAPFEHSLSADCVHTGTVLRSPDTENDPRLHAELCRPLGIRALIVVPIVFEARVAGVLELHFAYANSFHDQDVRICQLLASLLAEALGKENQGDALASQFPAQDYLSAADTSAADTPEDKAAMLAALEKIKPQLERLAGKTASPDRASLPSTAPSSGKSSTRASKPGVCAGCGHALAEDEPFCGVCGSSRTIASTWSSLWDMQRAAEQGKSGERPRPSAFAESSAESLDALPSELDVLPSELEDIVAQFSLEGEDLKRALPPLQPFPVEAPPSSTRENGNGSSSKVSPSHHPSPSHSLPSLSAQKTGIDSTAEFDSQFDSQADESLRSHRPPVKAKAAVPASAASLNSSESPWTSAAKVQAWFETEHRSAWLARKWRAQRANVYLAASAGLLIAVLFGLGTPAPPAPSPATTSAGQKSSHKVPAQPELSASEKLLVGLGLAEAPPVPAYKGNPDAKVWIDLHTALYHCPGGDLYGKTVGGRFTSQKDAQQDNFQPALGRACD